MHMKCSAASLLVWVFIAQASCPVLTFQQSFPSLINRHCAHTSPRGPRACISTSISSIDITSAVDGLTSCSDIPYGMYAISGAISGASRSVARLLSYPLDTIKTLAQAESLDKDEREMQRIADKAVPRTFADLFRGVLISIVSAVPANSIFIVCFNSLDAYVPCLDRSSPLSFVLDWSAPAQHILFSAIATVPQNLFKIPAELIKQRSQLAKQRSQGADTRALPSPPSISSPPRSDSEAYLSGPFSSGVLQVLGDARQLIIRFGGLYQGGGAMMLREVSSLLSYLLWLCMYVCMYLYIFYHVLGFLYQTDGIVSYWIGYRYLSTRSKWQPSTT
jgi:hypothetical protein